MRYSVAEYDNFRVFTFLQLSSATYAIDGGVIKREPRWEPLTKDTRIVRVDFKKFLKRERSTTVTTCHPAHFIHRIRHGEIPSGMEAGDR